MTETQTPWPMASKTTDPLTSHLAEEEITSSGARKKQVETVRNLVTAYPGRTAGELSNCCELDRVQVARRLYDLKSADVVTQGDARTCAISRRKAVTWYLNDGR